MRTHARRPNARARSWLALAFLLSTAVADAAEPVDTGPVARPRIGRIFFSPAERRSRHRDGLAATPAVPTGSGAAPRERRIVNGALSSGTRGRAVWVDGAAVEDSVRDKSAWTDRNGNVWLMNGTQGTHLVKPGQSIDRNGVIEDLLPAGSVARR
jgi:hypothetical protein